MRQRFLRISPDHVPLFAQVPALVDLRGGRVHGFTNVPNRRQDLITYLHQVLCLFEDLRGFCNHQGNRVSDAPCAVSDGDHDVPVPADMTHLVDRHILCRKDRKDAGERKGSRGINGDHLCPRVLCPDGAAIGHRRCPVVHHLEQAAAGIFRVCEYHAAVQGLQMAELLYLFRSLPVLRHKVLRPDIVRILAVAKDLAPYIDADGLFADASLHRCRLHHKVSPEYCRRHLHRLEDLLVTRAAAEIPAKGLLHLVLGRIRHPPKKPCRRDHHAGRAEAALHGAAVSEGIDKGVLLPVRKTLHRGDGAATGKFCRKDTGPHRFIVYQHHAGPAGALRAAVLYRIQVQLLPQKDKERLLLRGFHPDSVDCKGIHVHFKCL